MSELTISISDKADALIAQLQKEIFNRRRKKVTKEKVVETLLESGAKSQSDKRFATSWQNLLADIERAARVAQTHGNKPSTLSDEEWALVLSHRTRVTPDASSTRAVKPRAVKARAIKPRAKATADAPVTPARRRAKAAPPTADVPAAVIDQASAAPRSRGARAVAKAKPARAAKATATTTAKPKAGVPARAASSRKRAAAPAASDKPEATKVTAGRKSSAPAAKASRSSVARRMAKAASRLVNAPITAMATPPAAALPANGGNGVESSGIVTQLPS